MQIASRYATAIFDLAVAKDAGATVSDELSTLAAALKDSPELAAFLANPLTSRESKGDVLVQLMKKGNELSRDALVTISQQGRAELIPEIAEALAREVAQARGELIAEITSARPLAAAVEKKIAESLKRATGKTVIMQLKQDPAVLGGVRIRLGSLLLDATLEAALRNLRAGLLATA